MKVTVTDQVIELGFDRSALHEAQRRALEWLLEDSELAAVGKDENTVQIQREWWYAAGELPASDATEEEADVWASRHAALAALLGYRGQSVHVDARGYLGGPNFQFSLVVDGQPLDPGSESPLAGETLLLPGVYRAQRLISKTRMPWPKSGQLATLAQLREQLSGAARLLAAGPAPLKVSYRAHLADISIRSVRRASLGWAPSRTKGLFSLQLDAIDSEGERAPLNLGNLDADAPVISESAKQHILLSPDVEVAARSAKAKGIVPKNRVSTNPLDSLPDGYTYDGIELGDYSSRVLGFGPLEKAEAEGQRASQVEWYVRDDDEPPTASAPTVELQLPLASGDARALAARDLARVRSVQSECHQRRFESDVESKQAITEADR